MLDTFKLRKSIIKGSIWSILGQLASLFTSLLANIWLARLLSPREFGQLGIIMVFIVISNVLTEGGLSAALVRKVDATKEDYSTIFIVNVCISICCFLIIFYSAEILGLYYNDITLVNPLKAISIVLIINSLQIVQTTRLIANMEYKKKAVYDFISALLSSVIGVFFAYKGFGIWSLICMQISNSLFKTFFLWIFEKFHFKLIFSRQSFLELYSFGVNTTLSSVLNILFDNVYQLVFGKIFSVTQVGYFYQAKRLNDINTSIFNSISQGPVYSGLVKFQKDKTLFTKSYNSIINILLSALGLITILIFYYSDTLMDILFGSNWIESGIYLKYLVLSSYFFIQENFNRIIFKTYNKTRKILYLDFLKKTIQIISIIIGVLMLDFNVLLIGLIVSNAIGYTINYYVSRTILSINKIMNKELAATYLVLLAAFLTVMSISLIQSFTQLSGSSSLLFIAVIIPFYFLFLKFFRVIDLSEIMKIIVLSKKK